MMVGRVLHRAVLLDEEPVIFTEAKQRRGKVWDAFQEEHADVEDILIPSEARPVLGMLEAVRSHSVGWNILRGPGTQQEVLIEPWEYLGRACSSRLDTVSPNYIADLKTTAPQTIAPERFRRQTENLGYHAQMCFYGQAAVQKQLTDKGHKTYVVAVESKPPHDVVCYELTPNALEEGEKLCRLWMELLLNCEASDHWPGYGEAVLPLDVYSGVELDWGEE